jgi:hypothetical protein
MITKFAAQKLLESIDLFEKSLSQCEAYIASGCPEGPAPTTPKKIRRNIKENFKLARRWMPHLSKASDDDIMKELRRIQRGRIQ